MLSHFDRFGHCSLALRLGDALEQDQARECVGPVQHVWSKETQSQTNHSVLFC